VLGHGGFERPAGVADETLTAASAERCFVPASELEQKPSLRTVNLQGNQLVRVPDLSAATKLEKLLVDDNAIRHVSPLIPLTWVQWIQIGRNPVEAGLCPLARSRSDRPSIRPFCGESPGWDQATRDAIAACGN
jgi:Leucine-rich repeat (LRR) protein